MLVISCAFRVDNGFEPCIMQIMETRKAQSARHEYLELVYHHIEMNIKETEMDITKAMDVEHAYDTAAWDDNISSEGCYALAVAAAIELGGVEIYNSNDGNSTISFAPTRAFEFDDASTVQVMYGGVYVID